MDLGTVGTAAGDIPAVGSIFDSIDYDEGAYPEIYSDLVSTDRRRGRDLDIHTTLSGTSAFPPVSTQSPPNRTPPRSPSTATTSLLMARKTFTGINGLPPADVAIQGTQEFDVTGSDGTGPSMPT